VAASILPPEGEHLATGWEPELPPEDSLVRQAVLAHAEWAVELGRSAGGPWYDGESWAGGVGGTRTLFANWVVLKQPVDAAAVVSEVQKLFPPEVSYLFVCPWPTSDLTSYGLGLAGHPPLMARLPVMVTEPPETDLEIRRVDSPGMLADAERVLVEGYPFPELQPFSPGALLRPELMDRGARVWVGYDGEVPLATSTAYEAAGVNLVENVAVMPAARGHRAGAAITWAATANAPDVPAVLIASDDGQPVYERLGYLRVERWTVWVRS
jgi:hypothetical protein